MRKRRNPVAVEMLEQRRLLSAVANGIITIQYNGSPTAPAPTTGDLGLDAVSIYGMPEAGQSLYIEPDVVETGAMRGLACTINIALSTDAVWGNGDDIAVGSMPWIMAGDNPFFSPVVQIPASVPAGNYQLLFQISPGTASQSGQTFLPDTNPSDDVLDAGTFSILAAGSVTMQPQLPTDYGLLGASAPSSAAAGGFINVVPQVVQTGVLDISGNPVSNPYTVSVALSSDSTWGNGDDIALTGNVTTGSGTLYNLFHSGELQIPSTVAPGNYQLLMKVSGVKPGTGALLTDANPADDVLDLGPISVSPYVVPDLGLSGATFPSTAPGGSAMIDVEPAVIRTGALANVDYDVLVDLSPDGSANNPNNYSLLPLQGTDGDFPLYHSGDIFITGSIPPGTYHVILKVEMALNSDDGFLQGIDADSSDDQIDAGFLTITPNERDDLGVSSANFPATAAAGSTIQINPTFVQTGSFSIGDFYAQTALSSSGIWGDSNNILLSSSDIQNFSNEITIPSTVPPGSYQLLIDTQAMPTEDVSLADTNPADDMLDAGTITITADQSSNMIVASPPSSEMALLSVSYPTSAQAGTEIDVEPTKNSAEMLNYSYNVSFALSTDEIWGNSDDIAIGPVGDIPTDFDGGQIAIPSDVAPGTYQLLLYVSLDPSDSGGGYYTINIPSNQAAVDAGAITITSSNPSPTNPILPIIPPTQSAPTGDDSVTSATFPTTAAAGTDIDVEPTVSRTGGLANVDYNISVQLSTSGVWGDSGNITLDPDQSGFFTIATSFHAGNVLIPSDVPAGDYQLLVQVQPYQDIVGVLQSSPIDTNPSNDVLNAGTITVTPYVAPDDSVTGATFPSSAAAGSNIDVEPTVVQQGTLAGTGYQITVELSTSGIWGDSSNYELSGQFLPGGNQLFTAGLPYTGGNIGIPTNVPAGNYQLLVQIQPYSFLTTLNNPLPTDTNPRDDVVDAGTTTITPYISTINPGGPIVFPTQPPALQLPAVEAMAGRIFKYPSSSTGKYTALYLSTDDILDVPRTAPLKLLKVGATVTLATPDTKLKMVAGQSVMVPANMAPGTYDLLAISQDGLGIENIETVTVDAPPPSLQIHVRVKHSSIKAGGSTEVTMTIRDLNFTPADNASFGLFASKDLNVSEDDFELNLGSTLTGITVPGKGTFSASVLVDFPMALVAGKYYLLAEGTTESQGAASIQAIPQAIKIS